MKIISNFAMRSGNGKPLRPERIDMGAKIISQVGNYKVALVNLSLCEGHNDSMPYTGTLFINSKRIGSVHNDGWGGVSQITVEQHEDEYDSLVKFLSDKREHFTIGGKEYIIHIGVPLLCDTLAYDGLIEKKSVTTLDIRDY